MKKIIFLLVSFIFIQTGFSQTYWLNNGFTDGETITTCAGIFYDGGGASNYADNESWTVTFQPSSTTQRMSIYFNSFAVDNTDTLWIYDGNSTSAPLIQTGQTNQLFYNNSNSLVLFPVKATLANLSGALTFKFKSNAATNAAGWDATISCYTPCQIVLAGIDSLATNPMPIPFNPIVTDSSHYIDICFGDPIKFIGKGNYPENNFAYSQSDASSTFIWNFGDGVIDSLTGMNILHTYNQVRGYDVQLTMRDANGCKSLNAINYRVRISGNPIAHLNALPDICSIDSILVNVGYDAGSTFLISPIGSTQSSSQRFDSTMFIPDGPNCNPSDPCYNTDVNFNCFMPGQTITAATDILSVCVNIEHSFNGDLSFTIICPNGQQAVLKTYLGSAEVNCGAYLGVPYGGASHDLYDNGCLPADNPPGVGWNYCWSQVYPQISTMNTQPNAGTIDSTNTVNHTHYFTPDQSFTNLIGCPLNGTWTIKICDQWAIDNGYIFSWDLNLDPNLLPVGWQYSVPIDTVMWTGPYIFALNDTSAVIKPPVGNNYNYTFTLVDAFGCHYDTTFLVNVLTQPIVNLGPDTAICAGQIIELNGGGVGTNYTWSTGATGPDSIIYVNTPDLYWVVANNSNGNISCIASDTINILMHPSPVAAFSANPHNGCEPLTVNFTDNTLDTTVVLWNWDFGDGSNSTAHNPTHTYMTPGTYSVSLHVKTAYGCEDNIVINNMITVYDVPEVSFVADPTVIDVNGTITFTGSCSVPNVASWSWAFNDGNTASGQVVTNTFTVDGTYTVTLTVTTTDGCVKTYSSTVTVEPEFLFPNVITPNGDNTNDKFEIKGLLPGRNNTFVVYNRWGKKIYEKGSYDNSWTGEGAADGVYYYIFTWHSMSKDADLSHSGSVTIIR
ncbi:MAG: PKD domain-containing protein [Bacteroidota bacterium]